LEALSSRNIEVFGRTIFAQYTKDLFGEIMKNVLLGALALVTAAAAVPASAADLPLKSMAPPAPIYNWNGFYIGGNAGVAWSGTLTGYSGGPGAAAFFAANDFPASLTPGAGGYLGGAQIGYNWQLSPTWLVGLEADIQGGDYKGNASVTTTSVNFGPFTTSVEQHNNWFGTVRGRVGLLVGPNVLFYGTGGFAYGQTEASQSTIANGFTLATCPTALPCAAGSATSTRYGWAAGAGWEIMASPNWTFRAEYLFLDLGTQSLTVTTPAFTPPVTFTSSNAFHESIIRIGFNYLFSGPVVAKY
jgi:outer membrane immunogenic protein